ncbi:hypothetical protein EH223_15920 [candidate division KSB1 bacterium]|nr:hypothetical protein [candidate division KSB1 bacterium]RQW01183.1 MAG: hypothetical protein EH223_15920 [candidate division KSB1 bacterium]
MPFDRVPNRYFIHDLSHRMPQNAELSTTAGPAQRDDIIAILEKSRLQLEKWIEHAFYKGYEPFDGLSSFLRLLTFNHPFAERILIQLVRQCPVNIRPIIGIKPHESTKGRAYMAAGYLHMFVRTGNQHYKTQAIACLDWLMDNKSPGYADYCWGNHFDWTNRQGRLPKFEPTIVWTSLIGQTFLDAYEILGEKKYLDVTTSICEWILALPREKTNSGTCLSYVAFEQSSIHNSNLLGAAMLARAAKYTHEKAALAVAKEAVRYSCTRQLTNGAWYYGEAPMHHWIDNFHTCYNLDSLKYYFEQTNDATVLKNIQLGFTFLIQNFFEKDGMPKYYPHRIYPIDIQCASQAIETLANYTAYDELSLRLSLKVALWTIKNMQDKSGYFYYRQLPRIKVKIPMLHWGQATMYKALTRLLTKI